MPLTVERVDIGRACKVVTSSGSIEGFTAAWVAERALKEMFKWIELKDGDLVPEFVPEDQVVLLGTAFDTGRMIGWQNFLYRFALIDNDKDVRRNIGRLAFVRAIPEQTLARMAAQYFMVDIDSWILDYTPDHHRWKWPHVSQGAVNTYMLSVPRTFETWDQVSRMALDDVEVRGNEQIKKYAEMLQKEALKKEEQSERKREQRTKKRGKRAPGRARKGAKGRTVSDHDSSAGGGNDPARVRDEGVPGRGPASGGGDAGEGVHGSPKKQEKGDV